MLNACRQQHGTIWSWCNICAVHDRPDMGSCQPGLFYKTIGGLKHRDKVFTDFPTRKAKGWRSTSCGTHWCPFHNLRGKSRRGMGEHFWIAQWRRNRMKSLHNGRKMLGSESKRNTQNIIAPCVLHFWQSLIERQRSSFATMTTEEKVGTNSEVPFPRE